MHAMTIDALAGGDRVILGVGLSGPQIVEGWYGQPWGKPNARLRDYVAILRKVLAREAPVSHDGPEISLPYRGPGSIGQGKPLRTILHPAGKVQLWLGVGGPKNVELCGEVADGWLPMGFAPAQLDDLQRGFAKRGGEPDGFQTFVNATIELTDDVKAALDRRRPLAAMYVGGMGSQTHNFHKEAMIRQGFPEAAERIQELWVAGRKDEAAAAMPDAFIEKDMLLGDEQRIRRRWAQWTHPPGVTGLIANAETEADLRLLAALRDGR
jgi:F420-dependent oxidoreductase-like protein